MARNENLFNAIVSGDKNAVVNIVQHAVNEKLNVEELLNESMIPAMKEIGDLFSRNEAFVPEMLISARSMQAGLAILEPLLNERGHKPVGKICIGTVRGDLHDIGKNLVAMMLKGAGFEVVDLGVDCEVELFRKAVHEGSQAVLLSSLLTTTMTYMKTVIDSLEDFPAVKIIVGGAPVTREYAESIGAHGFSEDAGNVVAEVSRCLGIA